MTLVLSWVPQAPSSRLAPAAVVGPPGLDGTDGDQGPPGVREAAQARADGLIPADTPDDQLTAVYAAYLAEGGAMALADELEVMTLKTVALLDASGVTPVAVTLSAIGASPAFTPILGRPFNVTHKPSGFTGSYQLEKKFVGDATWYVALGYADLPSLPESFALTETEAGVTYRWNMTARTAGSVAVRISA
jgi:hypothetical protein